MGWGCSFSHSFGYHFYLKVCTKDKQPFFFFFIKWAEELTQQNWSLCVYSLLTSFLINILFTGHSLLCVLECCYNFQIPNPFDSVSYVRSTSIYTSVFSYSVTNVAKMYLTSANKCNNKILSYLLQKPALIKKYNIRVKLNIFVVCLQKKQIFTTNYNVGK